MRSWPNEPCPPSSWDPCLLWRWRGWRAAVEWWLRCRLSTQLARFYVAEFDVFDFIDRTTDGCTCCVAMTVNFAQGVVSPRLGACQHSINPLEDNNLDL